MQEFLEEVRGESWIFPLLGGETGGAAEDAGSEPWIIVQVRRFVDRIALPE